MWAATSRSLNYSSYLKVVTQPPRLLLACSARVASSALKSQAPLPCMGAGSSSRFCTFTSDAQRDFDRWEAIKQRQGLHFDQISSNFSGQFCSIGEQSVILG